MQPRQIRTALLILSVVYGALVAILAVLDSGALGAVAAVGAILLGAGWAISGLTGRLSERR